MSTKGGPVFTFTLPGGRLALSQLRQWLSARSDLASKVGGEISVIFDSHVSLWVHY